MKEAMTLKFVGFKNSGDGLRAIISGFGWGESSFTEGMLRTRIKGKESCGYDVTVEKSALAAMINQKEQSGPMFYAGMDVTEAVQKLEESKRATTPEGQEHALMAAHGSIMESMRAAFCKD